MLFPTCDTFQGEKYFELSNQTFSLKRIEENQRNMNHMAPIAYGERQTTHVGRGQGGEGPQVGVCGGIHPLPFLLRALVLARISLPRFAAVMMLRARC